MNKVRRFLSSIDIFDKSLDDEFRIRTKTGAVISMIFSSIGMILFFAQMGYFVAPDVTRSLSLNRNITAGSSLVNISISLVVDFPCHLLHLDVLDTLGFTQLYANTVTRRRYSRDLRHFYGIAEYPQQGECGECYKIRPESECCNSCEELILLSLAKGQEPKPQEWKQCKNYSSTNQKPVSLDESCLLKGKLTVNKVPGEFQVIFTRSMYSKDAVFEYPNFNLSHIFGRLRFGPKIPVTSTPLEHSRIIQTTNEPVQVFYDLLCTAVVLTKDETEVIARSFEYTTMRSIVGAGPEKTRQPGIYTIYQFTPYTVVVNYRMKQALEMVPTVLSVAAGAYFLASLVDSMLYKESSQTQID